MVRIRAALQYLHTPAQQTISQTGENKQEIDGGPLHQAVAISTTIIRTHMSLI